MVCRCRFDVYVIFIYNCTEFQELLSDCQRYWSSSSCCRWQKRSQYVGLWQGTKATSKFLLYTKGTHCFYKSIFFFLFEYFQLKGDTPQISIETKAGNGPGSHAAMSAQADEKFIDNKLTEENKGFKMMKMMGWKGGALADGAIDEPISVQLKVNRTGLGLAKPSGGSGGSGNSVDHKFFMGYLHRYKRDEDNIHELVFSKDFSKEERAALHSWDKQIKQFTTNVIYKKKSILIFRIAARVGLKSRSKNTEDGDRYLIVSKKIPMIVMANNVYHRGIYASLYELVPPKKN